MWKARRRLFAFAAWWTDRCRRNNSAISSRVSPPAILTFRYKSALRVAIKGIRPNTQSEPALSLLFALRGECHPRISREVIPEKGASEMDAGTPPAVNEAAKTSGRRLDGLGARGRRAQAKAQ